MVQLEPCLLYKDEGLSLIYRTHTKMCGMPEGGGTLL